MHSIFHKKGTLFLSTKTDVTAYIGIVDQLGPRSGIWILGS